MTIIRKFIINIFIFFVLLATTGCDKMKDQEFFKTLDCDDCDFTIPESADLVINLTINDAIKEVKLTVFKGDIDDRKIIFDDVVNEKTFYLNVDVDQLYSAKARYITDGNTLDVYDGSTLSTKKGSECEPVCWYVVGGRLDLEID